MKKPVFQIMTDNFYEVIDKLFAIPMIAKYLNTHTLVGDAITENEYYSIVGFAVNDTVAVYSVFLNV